jgi:hypothetical protein
MSACASPLLSFSSSLAWSAGLQQPTAFEHTGRDGETLQALSDWPKTIFSCGKNKLTLLTGHLRENMAHRLNQVPVVNALLNQVDALKVGNARLAGSPAHAPGDWGAPMHRALDNKTGWEAVHQASRQGASCLLGNASRARVLDTYVVSI